MIRTRIVCISVAACVALGLSTAAHADPCDNPHDRDPTNSNHLTSACYAAWTDVLAEYDRTRKAQDAAESAASNWDVAQTICRNSYPADDPLTPLCQQVHEREQAIAKAKHDAEVANELDALRRGLVAAPNPTEAAKPWWLSLPTPAAKR